MQCLLPEKLLNITSNFFPHNYRICEFLEYDSSLILYSKEYFEYKFQQSNLESETPEIASSDNSRAM